MSNNLDLYTVFDLIAELVFVAECDTLRILFANAAACQIVGHSQDQMLHLKFTDLYPDLADRDLADLASQMTPFMSNLMCADGSRFSTKIRFAPQLFQETPCIVCVADLATDLHTVARSLQEQRMIYRALVMGIFDLVFRIRRDGTYVDFKIPNGLGLYQPEEASEIIGRTVAEVVPAHVTATVMPVIERVIATGQPETVEYHIEESNGLHYYEAHFAASLPDEIIAVVRDITDTKRTETVLRRQRDLSVALSSSISLEQALTKVLDSMIKAAQMDCGGVYLIHPETGALHLKQQRGLPNGFIEQASFFSPDAPQTRIIKRGDAIYGDYRELPIPLGDPAPGEDLRAFAMIPIHDQHEVIGCINLASCRLHDHDINRATRDVLKTMAFHSGNAIMRLRIEEKLRESEETARTLLNAPTDAALLIDRQYTLLAANKPGAHLVNASVDTLVGQCMLDYVPPNLITDSQERLERVFRTGKPERFEDIRDERQFFISYYPVLDANGHVSRIAIFARDVTKERQADEALRRRDRLLEAVAQASNFLLATDDMVVAVNEALKIVGKATQADRAYIFWNHAHPETGKPATSQRYYWAASTHEESLYDDMQNREWHAEGLTDWYDTLRTGNSIVGPISRFSEPERRLLESFGMKSLLLVPIFIDQNEFWGFVGFDDRNSEREWLPEEVAVLRLMSASVGAAITRQNVEDTLRREHAIADTLREVGMVLTSTLDLDEVLKRLLEQAKRVVPYDAANVMLIEEDVARIVVHAGYGSMGVSPDAIAGTKFRIKDAVYLADMIQTGKPHVCSDVTQDSHWIFKPASMWTKSWLGTPIQVRDTVVGFFSLDSHIPDFYGQQHIELIEPFVKQAAIALENASLFAEIQSLERIKSEMIRIASHDLRSPLMRIQETITSFKRNGHQNLTEQQAKYCNLIGDAAQDMDRIISNILSLERIEAQHQATKTISWCDLVEQSVAMIRSDLTAKQHRLTVSCEDDLPNTRGDPDQLQQALVNLLGNAIKFTPPGGAITVRAYRKPYGVDETVAVEVEDNGIGVPYEQQSELFRPFYRARQSEVEHVAGTGLGLSIVKKVVEYHQGKVYVNSIPDEGSVFGFWVPI
jgi:PAS domain S-box-containing protein